MAAELPVMVEVEQPDGSQGFVRVGTARRDGAYFVLDLGALRISPLEAPPRVMNEAPLTMPQRPMGGSIDDLEYIAARARRTLGDSSKAKWHAQERVLLRQVEAELLRCKEVEKKSE